MRARERNKDGGKIGAAKALEKKSRTGKKWKVYVRVIESEPRERKRKKETKTERRETKRKIYIYGEMKVLDRHSRNGEGKQT